VDEVHRRLARNIRRLARKRGILLSHVPDRAAVGRSHFFAVLGGERSPTLAWLTRVARALGVDVVELLTTG
jgi:hypothetical protein